MGIDPVEFSQLWYRLSEIEQQRLIECKRKSFGSSIRVGTVVWVPDDLSGVPKEGGGEHPLVLMKIDETSVTVTAYLRTSQDLRGRKDCLHTPAGLVAGLNKEGYIRIANPVRLSTDDLADHGRIAGNLPPEWVEKIQEAIRAYRRERITPRRGQK